MIREIRTPKELDLPKDPSPSIIKEEVRESELVTP
jgi:hypothetical protein